MSLDASDGEEVEISNQKYFGTIASFWNSAHQLLCVGALIKLNRILTVGECANKLQPYNETYVQTAIRHFLQIPSERIINSTELVGGSLNYHLVHVSFIIYAIPKNLNLNYLDLLLNRTLKIY